MPDREAALPWLMPASFGEFRKGPLDLRTWPALPGPPRNLDIPYKIYIASPGMWEIYEHRRVGKQIDVLPLEILKRYEKWKDIAIISGPAGLRLIKGFHDETLRGEWQGYRSSRLGIQYRVIYRVLAQERGFQVVSITAHDYRRK